MSRVSVEKVLSHSAEKCRKESFSLSLVSDIEKVWMSGSWGGGSRLSVEKLLSHSAEKNPRATL